MQSNPTKRVLDSFLNTMNSLALPKEKFGILLGFSGGADSTALLNLLYKFKTQFSYELYAIHINHMIRGDEADRDENFCKDTCDKLSVPFYVHRADVPGLAKEKKAGIEETARDVRYRAFAGTSSLIESATGNKILVATAHNADDNSETIIFNMVRGSSLSGLCGIKARRNNIIRPLILSSKDDILSYCRENCIEYITDSTNSDTLYTRNKIRAKVMPVLREINPSLSDTISRMSKTLSYDRDYLDSVAQTFVKSNYRDGRISLEAINSLHYSIKSRVICFAFAYLTKGSLTDAHITSVIDLCEKGIIHSKVNLPGEYTAKIGRNYLSFEKDLPGDSPSEFSFPLKFGITEIPGTGDIVARFDSSDRENIEKFKNIYKIFIQTEISSDKIVGDLLVRNRKMQDTYNLNGINRKLKKVLWEICDDPCRRDTLPLVCDNSGILWVPGKHSRTGTFREKDKGSQTLFFVDGKKGKD